MTGDAEFNEVFLDAVRLPEDAVVGEVGGGWRAALTMLMNERVTLGRDPLAMSSPVDFARVLQLISDGHLADDAVVRQRLAELWLLQRGLELLGNRIAEGVRAGEDPGPYASIGKLGAAQLASRTVALAADLVGPASAAWDPGDPEGGLWAYGQLFSPALSIAGGTDQIQRSIIGERLLGLPR
jgi:alkylation response protein AidB-like acyl-CoA dehydrogenase